jgi:hypothetical protein
MTNFNKVFAILLPRCYWILFLKVFLWVGVGSNPALSANRQYRE